MSRFQIKITIAVLVAVVALSVGAVLLFWPDGDAPASTPAPSTPAPSAPIAGCTEVDTREMYVQHAYACPDGTRVVTFADESARDDYVRVAEHFGTVVLDFGPTWAHIRI